MGCSTGGESNVTTLGAGSMGGESNVTTLGVGAGGGTWSGAVLQFEDNGRKDGAGSELGVEVRGT